MRQNNLFAKRLTTSLVPVPIVWRSLVVVVVVVVGRAWQFTARLESARSFKCTSAKRFKKWALGPCCVQLCSVLSQTSSRELVGNFYLSVLPHSLGLPCIRVKIIPPSK